MRSFAEVCQAKRLVKEGMKERETRMGKYETQTKSGLKILKGLGHRIFINSETGRVI
jgi:hypothetical protein